MFRVLAQHPINQFKKNPRFYALYDGFYLLVCVALIGLMYAFSWKPLFGMPQASWAPIFVLCSLAFIWAHVLIHNCTHGNLPKAINRLAGEVLGLIVIVRFASWDIIHMRHHRYSDSRTQDPHPNFSSFTKTVINTVTQVEQQLFQQYFDTWGDTAENRAAERRRAYVSYGTNIVLVAAWTYFLGIPFTLLVFLPANAIAGLFIIHFNWSTHNGERAAGNEDFQPVNLNHGYYRLGNKLFAGIYMHANHHTRPHLFNPAKWNTAKLGPAALPVDAAPAIRTRGDKVAA